MFNGNRSRVRLSSVLLARGISLLVLIPCVQSIRAETPLKVRVTVIQDQNRFSYSVINDEPITSSMSIDSFAVHTRAPITISGTPVGWTAVSDGRSYVLWTATEDRYIINPNVVLRGTQSLSGFQIETLASGTETSEYTIGSWDGVQQMMSEPTLGAVVSPFLLSGDLNADGKVDIRDATLALRIVVGLLSPTQLQKVAGDTNGDGTLDIGDVVQTLKVAVGLAPVSDASLSELDELDAD